MRGGSEDKWVLLCMLCQQQRHCSKVRIIMMMMMIGLNPGPRARTVKPGPRHLRTRPDPGQNQLGPHKARQCTPAGTEAVISALAPTASLPIKAAQNATTVDTHSKTLPYARGECTSSPQ